MIKLRTMLNSKIHRARVTGLSLDYEGSITIPGDLIEVAGILPNEQVEVLNLNNTARFNTYVIEGVPGTGQICLNGPAARLGKKGDIIIILSYCQLEESELPYHTPIILCLDSKNRVTKIEKATEEARPLGD